MRCGNLHGSVEMTLRTIILLNLRVEGHPIFRALEEARGVKPRKHLRPTFGPMSAHPLFVTTHGDNLVVRPSSIEKKDGGWPIAAIVGRIHKCTHGGVKAANGYFVFESDIDAVKGRHVETEQGTDCKDHRDQHAFDA